MTIASRLAHYAITTFKQGTIPTSVTHMATQALIDQYGVQIGGSEFSWSKTIYKCLTHYGSTTAHSSVTRYGDKLSPPQAAYINGCFAHAQDFDDSHQETQTHPGSVVIPAAIALGEDLDLSGADVLKSIVIGMEVMLRLAHSLCPACIEGGHHTPPTIGPFGAAIASGLLLKLNKKELTHALGICGSYSGGLVEYTVSGGSVKRTHTGLGARAGVEAALLAKGGMTGPDTIIEGDKGLWAVFGRGRAFPDRLFDQIGERYLLSTLMFKPYNCCYLIHPAIQAFLMLCQTHSLGADDIKTVTVGLSKFSISHAGTILIPKDELGAQFSTSFTLALALLKEPPGMWSYTSKTLTDSNIIALAKKITVYEDAEADTDFPKKNGCIVTIKTIQGKSFSLRLKDPKGSPKNLLTPEEVKEKFMKNTTPIIGHVSADNLYEKLLYFNKLKSSRGLHNGTPPTTLKNS